MAIHGGGLGLSGHTAGGVVGGSVCVATGWESETGVSGAGGRGDDVVAAGAMTAGMAEGGGLDVRVLCGCGDGECGECLEHAWHGFCEGDGARGIQRFGGGGGQCLEGTECESDSAVRCLAGAVLSVRPLPAMCSPKYPDLLRPPRHSASLYLVDSTVWQCSGSQDPLTMRP